MTGVPFGVPFLPADPGFRGVGFRYRQNPLKNRQLGVFGVPPEPNGVHRSSRVRIVVTHVQEGHGSTSMFQRRFGACRRREWLKRLATNGNVVEPCAAPGGRKSSLTERGKIPPPGSQSGSAAGSEEACQHLRDGLFPLLRRREGGGIPHLNRWCASLWTWERWAESTGVNRAGVLSRRALRPIYLP